MKCFTPTCFPTTTGSYLSIISIKESKNNGILPWSTILEHQDVQSPCKLERAEDQQGSSISTISVININRFS